MTPRLTTHPHSAHPISMLRSYQAKPPALRAFTTRITPGGAREHTLPNGGYTRFYTRIYPLWSAPLLSVVHLGSNRFSDGRSPHEALKRHQTKLRITIRTDP